MLFRSAGSSENVVESMLVPPDLKMEERGVGVGVGMETGFLGESANRSPFELIGTFHLGLSGHEVVDKKIEFDYLEHCELLFNT